MIRLGTPDDVKKYVCLDGDDAFRVHQAGCAPAWKDEEGGLWFKRNAKLVKTLAKLGIEI